MSLSSLGAVSRSALISTNFVWNQFKSSLFPPAPFVPEVALWPRERPWCLWTRARPEWTSRAGLTALLLCPGVLEDLLGELFCLFYGLLVALRLFGWLVRLRDEQGLIATRFSFCVMYRFIRRVLWRPLEGPSPRVAIEQQLVLQVWLDAQKRAVQVRTSSASASGRSVFFLLLNKPKVWVKCSLV